MLADIDSLSQEEARKVLHELQVHQIELEMQNEELRDAHVALDFERARYFDLYDLAPVGYCTVSRQGQVIHANLTAASLLGTTRSELLGRRWSQFIHELDADRYYLQSRKLLGSGESQSCEFRMVRRDGRSLWVQWSATTSVNLEGETELREVFSDITARKVAEQALIESGENYHKLFTSIDEGFCIIEMVFDRQGNPVDYQFLQTNPSFEKQSGLLRATGKRIRELDPGMAERWCEIYGEVALTGEPVRMVDEPREPGGHWFDVHASRLGGPESRKVAIVSNDITERMQVEIRLREAKAVADKANRAKSEFLSNMSHELRTPLNAVLGFAQLIKSGSPSPTPVQERNVDYILKAGWYLLALVDEILDLAVIESGRPSLAMDSVSLDEVMRECQAMVEQQAQTRGIRMRFPVDPAPLPVHADRKRVKQVLNNLLSNAIKYNRPEGSVQVDWLVAEDGRVRISVTDTGQGLSADQIGQLFQPFNRLGKEAGREQGTGIGLMVSKLIVEMMGGAIGVQSTVGEGSVFWLELNPATGAPGNAVPAQDESARAMHGRVYAPLRKLLYVEDNPANLALVEAIIARRPDIRLLTATDGDAGILLARANLPDVILMDLNLPGIDGTQTMNVLAGDPATARIPVVALSADASADNIERGLQAGFFAYVTKPIKVDEFMDTLDKALAFDSAAAGRTTGKERP
ncbi:hybrid sensor histidine kinase/response regulator [Arenimonas soli]|nr:ATP-binding protein [Arenimonas soli]